MLAWPAPDLSPDLAVVLVDRDGDAARRTLLQRIIEERGAMHPPTIVGVAQEEFESWLIADPKAASQVSGSIVEVPRAPDNLMPGEAKRTLADWTANAGDSFIARRLIAESMDLEVAANRSNSLRAFLADLRRFVIASAR
ncbi:MAG TPA: DUF4276 family protein [Polyangiaceae bacterium]|nr:DUF4276 family protein [Polyangiaceae bacterium]